MLFYLHAVLCNKIRTLCSLQTAGKHSVLSQQQIISEQAGITDTAVYKADYYLDCFRRGQCMKTYRKILRELNIEHWKMIAFYLAIYDVIAVNLSYLMGLLVRFDFKFSSIPVAYYGAYLKFAPIYTVFSIIVFFFFKMYNSVWRFASFSELNRIMVANLITTVFQCVGITLLFMRMPFSYYIGGCVMQLILVVGVRFLYRFVNLERQKNRQNSLASENVMIIGAGRSGQMLIKELKTSDKTSMRVCCIIDDNPNKKGRYTEGVQIVGDRTCILEAAKKYEINKIIFSIPSASAENKRDILNICKETNCELVSLPGVYQIANGERLLSKMKPVEIEDLLGRDPIKVNMDEIFDYLSGKTILVTGGGGSIGSELCRQIAAHRPKQLIIFDIYENNAYDIEQELKRKYADLNLKVLIGSVRDSKRINSVFETYKPQIVYHAAAHKHVPLMETSPNEAIKNNVIGTYKTAYAAMQNGTERFVLISTDKAVNPTNIMGASKRLCEMVIQSMDAISKTGRTDLLPSVCSHLAICDDPEEELVKLNSENAGELMAESVNNENRSSTQFVAVRFGNVLGSNGSVIPLFKKQIEAGGPVTVTHPDIVRYFMTIPEAVSLVLEAGTYALGGEIFVLDMGEPVKIDSLARNLIRLSGYTPDVDIKIEYSGLRPGEKLYEECLMKEEGMKKTESELIHIGKPIPFNVAEFMKNLEKLAAAAFDNSENIVEMVEQVVPTFHPSGEHPENVCPQGTLSKKIR